MLDGTILSAAPTSPCRISKLHAPFKLLKFGTLMLADSRGSQGVRARSSSSSTPGPACRSSGSMLVGVRLSRVMGAARSAHAVHSIRNAC